MKDLTAAGTDDRVEAQVLVRRDGPHEHPLPADHSSNFPQGGAQRQIIQVLENFRHDDRIEGGVLPRYLLGTTDSRVDRGAQPTLEPINGCCAGIQAADLETPLQREAFEGSVANANIEYGGTTPQLPSEPP
jgi:hypothetical protein